MIIEVLSTISHVHAGKQPLQIAKGSTDSFANLIFSRVCFVAKIGEHGFGQSMQAQPTGTVHHAHPFIFCLSTIQLGFKRVECPVTSRSKLASNLACFRDRGFKKFEMALVAIRPIDIPNFFGRSLLHSALNSSQLAQQEHHTSYYHDS